MVATPQISPIEVVHPSGISWRTYETLLEELSDRSYSTQERSISPTLFTLRQSAFASP